MDQLLVVLKDYTAILVACLAAAVSIVNLALSTRLTEARERRKVIWERELTRFAEIEDVAGRLVEDLLRYKIREEGELQRAYEKLQQIREAPGHFLRYDNVSNALRNLVNAAGWYIREDMRFESRKEHEQARDDVSNSFKELIAACDEALKKSTRGR